MGILLGAIVILLTTPITTFLKMRERSVAIVFIGLGINSYLTVISVMVIHASQNWLLPDLTLYFIAIIIFVFWVGVQYSNRIEWKFSLPKAPKLELTNPFEMPNRKKFVAATERSRWIPVERK